MNGETLPAAPAKPVVREFLPDPAVVISIEGGLVVDVTTNNKLLNGLKVVVLDFDDETDGGVQIGDDPDNSAYVNVMDAREMGSDEEADTAAALAAWRSS